MHQIQKEILAYQIKNGTLPPRTSDSCADGWDVGPCGTDPTFISPLATGGYIDPVPVDPVGSGNYQYRYYVYPAGGAGCDASKGGFFVLGILRTNSNQTGSRQTHPTSPDWSCPGRNWQNEYDWVVGGFQ